jgi:Fe-S oxidoreductase
MQEQMQTLPGMAPARKLSEQQQVRQASEVYIENISAQFATYLESCIHCGHCAAACHFYQGTQDPQYIPIRKLDLFRKTYRRELGPFRWVFRLFTPALTIEELRQSRHLVFDSCTLCGRCSMICPMGIDIATMIHTARGALCAAELAPDEIRAVAAEQAQQDTVFGASPDKLRGLVDSLQEQVGIEIPLDKEQADILVLTSGLDIAMNPRGLLATAKVLNHLGVDWTLRSDGYESINFGAQIGDDDLHYKLASSRFETAKKVGAKTLILCECGHTYSAMRWAAALYEQPLPFEVVYIAEYLGREVEAGRLRLEQDGRALSFHDPCKTGRLGGVFHEPRAVLKAMGVELRETPDNKVTNWCCGGGGAVFLLQEATELRGLAYKIKLDQFQATQPDAVVTACGSCRLNFVSASQLLRSDLPVESLIELVASHLPSEGPEDKQPWRKPGKQ